MVENQWAEIIEANEESTAVSVDVYPYLVKSEPVSPVQTNMPIMAGRFSAELNSIRIQQIVVSGANSTQSGFRFETTLSRLLVQEFKFIPDPPIFGFFKPPKLQFN